MAWLAYLGSLYPAYPTIAVPSDNDGLRETFADAHRRYTGYINARLRATGHLWQGRFGSVVMDEVHLF